MAAPVFRTPPTAPAQRTAADQIGGMIETFHRAASRQVSAPTAPSPALAPEPPSSSAAPGGVSGAAGGPPGTVAPALPPTFDTGRGHEQEREVEGPDDDVLERLLGAVTDEELDEDEQIGELAREELGEAAPETKETDQEDHSPADADEGEPAATPHSEIESARRALERDGILSVDAIGRLTDIEVLSAAHRAELRRRDREREFQKLKATNGVDEGAPATDALPSQSISEMVSPLANRLDLDDDGAKDLADSFTAVLKPIVGAMSGLNETVQSLQVELARRDLADRFPELSDPASKSCQSVVDRMKRMGREDPYGSVSELMLAAVEIEAAPRLREGAQAHRKKMTRHKARGRVTTTTRAEPGKPATQADVEAAVLDLLERGQAAKARQLAERHGIT